MLNIVYVEDKMNFWVVINIRLQIEFQVEIEMILLQFEFQLNNEVFNNKYYDLVFII